MIPQHRIEQYLAAIKAAYLGETPLPEYPDEPAWRIEHFLAAILSAVKGDSPALACPEPVWHIEEFLRAICDALTGASPAWPCPTATNNIEAILRAIYKVVADGTETESPAPSWDIERWLLGVYDAAKEGGGSKETVTGDAPITLIMALEKAIISLTQYGLCTQASTPSQADPVPIKCNNGTLKWDSVNQRVYADGTPEVLTIKPGVHLTLSSGDFESGSINESGEEIEDANSVRTKGFVTVDPGTDYIVVLLTNNNNQLVMPIAEYSSEEVFIKRDTPDGARGRLIITGNNTGKIRIIVNCEGSFPPWSITSVSLDTTLSSYNPAGKNLYSHQNSIFGYYLSSSGVPTIGPRACYSCKIPVDPAKSYTWSGISGEAGTNNKRVCFYKSNDTRISAQTTSVAGKQSPYTFTFTPPANTAYCRLSLNTADADVMLEEGSSKTTFEPYRDADWQTASVVDLLSVGDSKDEHEIISGSVKRKCAACVYDGTQVIGDVYMSETGGKDVGAIIVYPVSETTESVAAQPLSTIQGGNIISVIAEVSPIALSATYKKARS